MRMRIPDSNTEALGMRGPTMGPGFTRRSIVPTKIISLAFLGALAVKEWFRIHRQDAKRAKNFAKQNSFQESKDLRLCSTDLADPRGFFGSNPPNPRKSAV